MIPDFLPWLLANGVQRLAELHCSAVRETLLELQEDYLRDVGCEAGRVLANIENYKSHKWVTKIQSVPGNPPEPVSYCDECGHSNYGDPREFDHQDYHNCADMKDLCESNANDDEMNSNISKAIDIMDALRPALRKDRK